VLVTVGEVDTKGGDGTRKGRESVRSLKGVSETKVS
jgi:hypothetical protein